MAITFTSNQKATKYIRDRSGYTGASDFTANLDFAARHFVDTNWNQITPESVLNVSRNSEASIMLSEDFADHVILPENTLRLSYIPDYKSFGLIATGGVTFNSLADPLATTIYIADDQGGGRIYYPMYAEQGTLSLTTTSGNAPTILQGDGSANNPLFFTLNGELTATINRSVPNSKVYCQRSPKGQCPFIPNFKYVGIQSDAITINNSKLGGVEGALVMKYGEPVRQVTNIATTDRFRPVLLIKQDADNYFAMYCNATNKLATRFYVGGVEKFNVVSSFTIDPTVPIVLKASWKNGVISIYFGDTLFEFNSKSMPENFNVTSVKLAGALENWIAGPGQTAIFNLVTYNRALSNQELLAASYL